MANLEIALQQLREERSRTQLQVETLDQAISVIESLNGTGVSRRSSRPTRIVSAVSRRRMAQAQRARWAKTKGHSPKPKRRAEVIAHVVEFVNFEQNCSCRHWLPDSLIDPEELSELPKYPDAPPP